MLERSASKGNFDDVLATSGAGNAEAASGATHGETRESRSRHDSQGDGGSPDAGKRTTLYSSTASLLKVRDKFTDFRPAWRTGFAHRKEWVAPTIPKAADLLARSPDSPPLSRAQMWEEIHGRAGTSPTPPMIRTSRTLPSIDSYIDTTSHSEQLEQARREWEASQDLASSLGAHDLPPMHADGAPNVQRASTAQRTTRSRRAHDASPTKVARRSVTASGRRSGGNAPAAVAQAGSPAGLSPPGSPSSQSLWEPWAGEALLVHAQQLQCVRRRAKTPLPLQPSAAPFKAPKTLVEMDHHSQPFTLLETEINNSLESLLQAQPEMQSKAHSSSSAHRSPPSSSRLSSTTLPAHVVPATCEPHPRFEPLDVFDWGLCPPLQGSWPQLRSPDRPAFPRCGHRYRTRSEQAQKPVKERALAAHDGGRNGCDTLGDTPSSVRGVEPSIDAETPPPLSSLIVTGSEVARHAEVDVGSPSAG